MADFKSPSHALVGTDAQPLSTTDTTGYAAICVINRKGNSGSMQCGGADITNDTGGKSLDQGDDFWFCIPGRAIRLTEIYVAGTNGDDVDTICVPY